MKKIFILTAVMTAAIFTGCITDEGNVQGTPDTYLGFNVGNEAVTRAAIQDNDTIKDETLHVYSFYNEDGTSWRNFLLSYTTAGWSYGNPVYHPTGHFIHHFSTVPDQYAALTQLGNVSGRAGYEAPFTYTVKPVAEQEDLIAAKVTTSSESPTANLVYKHLLTKVNFTVKAPTESNIKLVITNLQFVGLLNSGTYPLSASEWQDEWILGQTRNGYFYPHDFSAVQGTDVVGDSNLMLMPQEFIGETTPSRIMFNYEIWQNDETKPIASGLSFYTLNEVWEQGEARRYIIDFDCTIKNLPKIKFTVSVEDWGEETTTNI